MWRFRGKQFQGMLQDMWRFRDKQFQGDATGHVEI
jgi:hypothetical protein